MKEKLIENKINFEGKKLDNDTHTEIGKWYQFESKYKIVKPVENKGFEIEINFPDDVRTGFYPSVIKLSGSNWMGKYGETDNLLVENLQREINEYRIKNANLRSMIEVFWNLEGFKEKNALVKKAFWESWGKVDAFLESYKNDVEDGQYGDEGIWTKCPEDFISFIDEFKKHIKNMMKEYENQFVDDSHIWKVWESKDYEK